MTRRSLLYESFAWFDLLSSIVVYFHKRYVWLNHILLMNHGGIEVFIPRNIDRQVHIHFSRISRMILLTLHTSCHWRLPSRRALSPTGSFALATSPHADSGSSD